MSRKVWVLIFLGVIVVHAALFMWMKDGPVIPRQWLETSNEPEPTFTHQEAKYTDPMTGVPMRVQEFTISTKLAEPVGGPNEK